MAKERIPTPEDIAAKVLFLSDRTCCVCHEKRKSVQIHHIDDDPSNNDIDNLAALCLQCHDDTQVKGGFGRKLNAAQVKMYRDDWYKVVAKKRANEGSSPNSEVLDQDTSLERQQDSDSDDSPIFPPEPYSPPFNLQDLQSLFEEYQTQTDEGMKVNIFAEIKELASALYAQKQERKQELFKTILPTVMKFYNRDYGIMRTNWLEAIS